MTNKNVSQLPINSDPQDSDWLLGASGNSPSVFQKIPVGSLTPATQNSGSIKFSLPVNQNTALTSSGYYFTDNIAANIGIDCSGLGIGEHINWVNLSTKAVVFYGFSTVNGVTIPANKGVKIFSANSIAFFLLDANHNIKIISGSYVVDWIPGQEPPYRTFNYTTYAAYDDIFNAIGTQDGTQSFVNPFSTGLITGSSSQIQGGYPLNLAFDHATGESRWNNQNNAENWIIIDLKTYTAKINKIVIYGGNWPTGGLNGRTIYFYGSDDATNWNLITSWTQGSGSQSVSPDFTTPAFYRYFKWYVPSGSWIQIEEFKWYGDILGL